MSVPTVAPVHAPPHDPLSLLLDGRVGWFPARADDVVAAPGPGGCLTLARDPASLVPLTAGAGTFGGLRPPSAVALDGQGRIWLLADGGVLSRFDPCGCRFVPVRSVGAGAVALAGDGDLVWLTGTDDGGQLTALAVPTTAPALRVRAPMTWQPAGVAVDRHHQVHVADPLGGRVHTFARTGRYLGSVGGVGASTAVAVDRTGRVWAAGPSGAYRIEDGTAVAVQESADEVAEAFPASPVGTDSAGNLLLGGLCVPPTGAAFDTAGRPVPPVPAPARPAFRTDGTVVLGPLDSRIDGCVWDRVVLHGDLPAGCAVALATLTAHAPLPLEDVDAMPEAAWRTRATATAQPAAAGGPAAEWDCLLTGDPGRYLWVRLRLTGSGSTTPALTAVEVFFPRISLRRHLPEVYGAEPESAAFTDRFVGLFDRSLRNVEARLDALPALVDPQATPALDWLSSWVGLAGDRRLPEAVRRRLLAASARLYDLRGTATGLRELLLLVLGLDEPPSGACCTPRAREAAPAGRPGRPARPGRHLPRPGRRRRWCSSTSGCVAGCGWGDSRIGDEAVLWGRRIVDRSQLGEGAQVGGTRLAVSQDPLRDPFHVYAHRWTVFLPASAGATPQQRAVLQRLLTFATPAHTAGQVEYVEPRFRIGVQSSLGLDAVVGRVPTGTTLGATPLGTAVLTGDPDSPGGPRRIGTTAVLR